MRRIKTILFDIVRFLGVSVFGALLILLRYVLKTPQPLESMLPGEARLFTWTHGHVFYKVLGVPGAPPLVLLHTPEIGGSSYEMRGLVQQLAQQYRVYALDLLGFGLSDRPNMNYSSETYTALCQDFLTEVVQQPALLVASGLSCNYSIAVASMRPELCERLVLLSPSTLFGASKRQTPLTRLLQLPFVGLFVYAFLTIRLVLRSMIARQQLLKEGDVSDDELDAVYAAAHQLGAHYAATAFLAGQLLLDVSQLLETLQTPILLLWGTKTSAADLSVAELYSGNEQALGRLIQGTGLLPHKEQPGEVITQITQWYAPTLQSIQATARPNHTTIVETVVVQEREESNTNTMPFDTTVELEISSYTKEYEEGPLEESATEETIEQFEAYCVKCKQKRIMQNPTATVTKNGRNANVGTCPVCETKLSALLRTKKNS